MDRSRSRLRRVSWWDQPWTSMGSQMRRGSGSSRSCSRRCHQYCQGDMDMLHAIAVTFHHQHLRSRDKCGSEVMPLLSSGRYWLVIQCDRGRIGWRVVIKLTILSMIMACSPSICDSICSLCPSYELPSSYHRPSGKMVFALDNFTSNNVALWSYEKITCISDTLYFHILAGDNLIG